MNSPNERCSSKSKVLELIENVGLRLHIALQIKKIICKYYFYKRCAVIIVKLQELIVNLILSIKQ